MTTLSVQTEQAQVSPTSGLQEAVDALGPAGGVLNVPAGEYLLRRPLLLPSRVTIRGEGAATILRLPEPRVTLLAADSGVDPLAVEVADAEMLRIGDAICLMEPRGNRWYYCRLLEVHEIDGASVVGRRLYGKTGMSYSASKEAAAVTAYPAIMVSNATDVSIESLAIEGAGTGPVRIGEYLMHEEFMHAAVIVHHSDRSRIRDITVRGTSTDGICVGGGLSSALVTGCVVEDCGGIGLHSGGGVQSAQFINNISRRNRSGFLFCQGNRHVICANNLVHHNAEDGIWGLDAADRFNVVANNVCHHNGRHGIEAEASISNTIQGNICRNNSQSEPGKYVGIRLSNHRGNLVTANLCGDDQETPTQLIGIQSVDPAGDNCIEGNLEEHDS